MPHDHFLDNAADHVNVIVKSRKRKAITPTVREKATKVFQRLIDFRQNNRATCLTSTENHWIEQDLIELARDLRFIAPVTTEHQAAMLLLDLFLTDRRDLIRASCARV